MRFLTFAGRPAITVPLALAGALVVGLGSAWLVTRGSARVVAEPGISPIERVEVQSSDDGSAAAAKASARLGFRVLLPASLPAGLSLRLIDMDFGTPGANDPTKQAMLYFGPLDGQKSDFKVVAITETPVRTEVPANHEPEAEGDTNRRIDGVAAGVEVWKSGALPRLTYTMWTADRTFFVVVDGSRELTLEELAGIAQGFSTN